MDFEVYTPRGILKNFVDSIQFLSGSGTGIALQRLQQTIIINMGANFRVSGIYTASPVMREQSDTVWINGKQEIPFMLDNPAMEMYVIGVRAGMLPFLADLPAIATNEQSVGAVHWTSREIYNLREQLFGCPTKQAAFARIEHYLTGLLLKKDLSRVDKINWLNKRIPSSSVAGICQALGVTRKQLRAETQYYYGDSAKTIQGILRFNHTLSAIARHADRPLSSLHPYYDQAHFIHDFKARSGLTPLQYKNLCRQFPFIKHTPNFLAMKKETFLQFISAAPA